MIILNTDLLYGDFTRVVLPSKNGPSMTNSREVILLSIDVADANKDTMLNTFKLPSNERLVTSNDSYNK